MKKKWAKEREEWKLGLDLFGNYGIEEKKAI
jgi:hypothetical protein